MRFLISVLIGLTASVPAWSENTDNHWSGSVGGVMRLAPLSKGSAIYETYILPTFNTEYQLDNRASLLADSVNGVSWKHQLGSVTYRFGIGYRSGLYALESFGLFRNRGDYNPDLKDPGGTPAVNTDLVFESSIGKLMLYVEKGLKEGNSGTRGRLSLLNSIVLSPSVLSEFGIGCGFASDGYLKNYYQLSPGGVGATTEVNTVELESCGIEVSGFMPFSDAGLVYAKLQYDALSKTPKQLAGNSVDSQAEFLLGYSYRF